ncbi:hypothetical protein AVEN_212092-1 [Araneus ventricosus]|uniref:Uncharacterized protein n=1 Tax=Araneus ventricosus TaxID=182803 RepID=A0A4Y2PQC1_ARAVE|nr:hypothetical protein AVEN_212092-1 [Araneus ventricosus]
MLTEPWKPNENFLFSVLGESKLKFQHQWFKRFPWLAYTSIEDQGALCKYCVIFHQETGVLVDSTTDISVTEKVSLCVRYVTQGDRSFSLREVILEFFSIKTATGRNLGNHILKALSSLGVNCSNLCGQGYDGASSMSGCFNGVQAVIKETNPAALYVHCSSHSLNLAPDACFKCPQPSEIV